MPYKSRSEFWFTLVDEAVIMLCLYCFICMSDLVPDVYTRAQIGNVCCAFVVTYLMIYFLAIMWTNICACRDKYRQKRLINRRKVLKQFKNKRHKRRAVYEGEPKKPEESVQ
jgi:uncharacterized membrane protein YcjF (UPF0283 family)